MKRRLIEAGRNAAFAAGVKAGVPRWLRPQGQAAANALLFHRFFDAGEARASGLERLRRELDWLRQHHTPISLSRLTSGLQNGDLPDRAVLVTADDALIDLIDVVAELKAFDVPLAVYVCAGWTAAASQGTGDDLVARAAAAIQWHEGQDVELRFGHGRMLALSPNNKARNIDYLIRERDALLPDLEELCTRIESYVKGPRQCCTWSELRDLKASGVVELGAHSVTHVWMSTTSPTRMAFEIGESKRLCDAQLGGCASFAYPFGMAETHSAQTRQALIDAGYTTAFLTHSDFITANSDTLTLPRISMPDESMAHSEFVGRASGMGIAMRRMKSMLRPTST